MTLRHDPQTVADNWRAYLMTGDMDAFTLFGRTVTAKELRRVMQRLPSDPRCKACRLPFRGPGGSLMKILGRRPSRMNPHLCDNCEQYVASNLGGAEVELTMLFADVRGSTTLGEQMNPGQYSRVINRFYSVVSDVLVRADALIEKLMGDEVVAMFVPGFAGPDHPRRAIETAQTILHATGHGGPEGPWVSLGVGVHTGTAYVGAVGSEGGVNDIVALGNTVNTAARLASMAAAGEVIVSRDTMEASKLHAQPAEQRSLQLKGLREAVDVFVLRSNAS
ncbi:MAG TPA: adenylate/guanylate cyclase domain-containing protein [Longimicrobiaceae bacterium]|nr:adenylate/guanylate cyclase domain-containing protein [Longimicrobiaceae bacterium]